MALCSRAYPPSAEKPYSPETLSCKRANYDQFVLSSLRPQFVLSSLCPAHILSGCLGLPPNVPIIHEHRESQETVGTQETVWLMWDDVKSLMYDRHADLIFLITEFLSTNSQRKLHFKES